MERARETNSGHWPHTYPSEGEDQISKRKRVRSKMIAAKLSTTELQLIDINFTHKFAMGWAKLRKLSPQYAGRGVNTIEYNISTVEVQLIPSGSALKIAMGASISPVPPTISGGGSYIIRKSRSPIGAQLNHPTLTFRFGIGAGGDVSLNFSLYYRKWHAGVITCIRIKCRSAFLVTPPSSGQYFIRIRALYFHLILHSP